MIELKRVYVYKEIVDEVLAWAKQTQLRTPNRKENLPFSLQQYIKHLKFQSNK